MTGRVRIAINGFGRIGRTILRQLLLSSSNDDIEIVAINDIAPLKTCAYLFQYDSVYGPYPGTIAVQDKAIMIDSCIIPFHSSSNLVELDLSGVDVVLECTGKVQTRKLAEAGLNAGAKTVLISGPSEVADTTIVLGGNDEDLALERIISNSSCTTNAIVPLLKKLDLHIGIEHAHITTIHCYTGGQPTVDAYGTSQTRSRAAAASMIPTSTSAALQTTKVLPKFNERLSVAAVRVPCLSVSAVDLVLQLTEMPSVPTSEFLREYFKEDHIVGLTEDACVSVDMRSRSESVVIAIPESKTVCNKQLRIFGWYDNEWGFSARMIEMARLIASKHTPGGRFGI